jgi:negative regulator of sigma E activity
MNEALKMQISAFVDGELPDNESELLLRRLSQDADMRRQVSEYLQIGRLIRQDREISGMDQLRQRIAAAIGEQSVASPVQEAAVGSKFMTPTIGIAIAASVAAVALFGLGQLSPTVDTGLEDVVAIDLAPTYTEPPASQFVVAQPTERLRDMQRRHRDSSTALGSGDILYRMATFELREGELVEIEPDPHILPDDAETDDVDQAGSE